MGDDPLRVDLIAGVVERAFSRVRRCVLPRADATVDADVVIVDVATPVARGHWEALSVGDGARVVVLCDVDGLHPWPDRSAEMIDVAVSPDQLLAVLDGAATRTSARRTADPGSASVLDPLTPREREVFAELASADDNRAIGQRLGISEHTVRTHVQNILAKLGKAGRAEVAVAAMSLGLPTSEGWRQQ